ncbi:DUF1120 domain-containing protein [Enterobacter sichuanensis]|uniref:DUF1120 domain-containing protein n=1 Tax=Enterobacter sichuanensis TaxID=2071710 RepID=UPI002B211903|nr:DUF1120 domain-containing protein [Enterobacter sichuanensis]MEA5169892.1 DUF1120 domain-containing protein [Enterobacter sichuanensis]
MKKIILATAIALCTTSALAAETTVMKVEGTLTSSTCEVQLGNGGVFDYGTLIIRELSATENNKFDKRDMPVTITCTAPTKVGFKMQDNRSDSNAQLPNDVGEYKNKTLNYYGFGVGKTNEGVKIGNYSLWMTGATADGKNVEGINKNDDWTTWSWAYTPRSDAFNTVAFSPYPNQTPAPIALTTASFNLRTSLVIRDTDSLAITDDTVLDGQATMTLVYL